jgi:hypothetical protein
VTQQHERRPPTRGAQDLTTTDGEPSPAAENAYARQRADVHIVGESGIADSFIRIRLRAEERSQIVTVITFAIAVLAGIASGLGVKAIGLPPEPAVAAGAAVWVVLSLLVLLRHRAR